MLYGGTELFLAQLAEGLHQRGIDVVVYTNGESTLDLPKRWLYEKAQWPIRGEVYDNLKDINHTTWAIADAAHSCDIIHLNNAPGLTCSRLVRAPFVYTVHHPHEDALSAFYSYFPEVYYVTISDFQRQLETMPRRRTIHHGLDLSRYELREHKQDYLSFIGRIAPVKGPHLAIAAAQKAGIPLKIAGEVQPIFRDYFEQQIKPHLDGKFIEYVGEADLKAKNELLGNSRAMLFPIQWDEPFGLVMIEAMACGTPVLALPGGSVPEIVCDGVSGWLCHSLEELADRARNLDMQPAAVRRYTEQFFSLGRMISDYVDLYMKMLGPVAQDEIPSPAARDDELAGQPRTAA
jgi:glycosyltransferase involved in cell wall biosynthesis